MTTQTETPVEETAKDNVEVPPTADELNERFQAFFAKKEDDMHGFEDLNSDTMAIPFIRILQDTSPWCKKSSEEYNPEAEPGMLINTVTGKLYNTPLRLVVGKFQRVYTEWKPNRGGFQGSHAPELVEKLIASGEIVRHENKLISNATGNEFSENYVYYIVMPENLEDEVCVMSMSSTQLATARKLNRVLSTTYIPGTMQKALPYFLVFELTTVLKSNQKGDWYAPVITLHSFVSQALLGAVVEQRKLLPNKTLDMSLLEDKTGTDTDFEEPGGDETKAKF